MPGLAKLNESSKKFRETYQRTISVLLLIAVPASLGLSAVAYPATMLLLGEKWSGAVPLVEVLAIYGIFRSVFAVSASAFMSSGKVKSMAQLSLFDLGIRAGFLSIGFAMSGVVGLAIGMVLAGFTQALVSLFIQQAIGLLRVVDILRDTWRVFLSSIAMYISVAFLLPRTGWLEEIGVGIALIVQVICGASTYVGILLSLWSLTGRQTGPERAIWQYIKGRSNGGLANVEGRN
jgi:O-antigen/teichoic acid export membrane protein